MTNIFFLHFNPEQFPFPKKGKVEEKKIVNMILIGKLREWEKFIGIKME